MGIFGGVAARACANRGILRARRAALIVGSAMLAIGLATSPATAGCNSGDTANTDLLSSANCQADASGGNAVAVGFNSTASGDSSVAIGFLSKATVSGATAVGNAAQATDTGTAAFGSAAQATAHDATAIGQSAQATVQFATAVGNQSQALADSASAFGQISKASGANSTAIGTNAQATQDSATALGTSATATGVSASALGRRANATATFATAVGTMSQATATDAVAVGTGAPTSGTNIFGARATNTTAVGFGATANVTGATALGQGASATAAGAVAVGQNSVANVANTFSVGTVGSERRIVNVAAGTLSSASTDAVNGAQLFATNSSVAALQGQIGTGTIGLVQQSAAGQPITVGVATDGTVVDFTGTAGTRKLTGISDGSIGAASADAIAGGQLYTANQRVAAAFGGGAGLDINGQLTAPSYAILGNTYNNVGGALGALNTQVVTNTTDIAANTTSINTLNTQVAANTSDIGNLQTQVSNGSIGLVQQNPTTRVITVGAATDGASVSVAGTAGDRTVTGVAAGAVSAASTDAVNGSQLFATNLQVAANTTAIANLSSTVAGLGGGGTGSNYIRSNGSGPAASATGANAASIGSGSTASGANSLAFGTNAQATQSGSIAVGMNASSTGTNAIAIGTGAIATGSVAVGAGATASNGGAAFGDGATATGANAAGLGTNASASAANSVAIGSGSTNAVANTVSFGSAGNERRLTNVAAGISPTDAVNVGQLQSTVSGFQSQIGALASTVDSNDLRARRGIAAAASMTTASMPSAPGKTSWAMNTAAFAGEVGFGASLAHRLNTAIPLYVSGGYSYGGGAQHIVRAGLGGEF